MHRVRCNSVPSEMQQCTERDAIIHIVCNQALLVRVSARPRVSASASVRARVSVGPLNKTRAFVRNGLVGKGLC